MTLSFDTALRSKLTNSTIDEITAKRNLLDALLPELTVYFCYTIDVAAATYNEIANKAATIKGQMRNTTRHHNL